jgi:thiol:disulfide interchange protein
MRRMPTARYLRYMLWAIACCTTVALPRVQSESILSTLLVPDKNSYAPGDTVVLAIECVIAPGHHLYANPHGPGIGKPLRLKIKGAEPIHWLAAYKSPPMRYQPAIDAWVWAYEKNANFFICGVLPPNASGTIKGSVLFDGLVCKTACQTYKRTLAFTIKIGMRDTVRSFASRPELLRSYCTAAVMPLNESPQKTITAPGTLPSVSNQLPQWDYSPIAAAPALNLWLATLFAFLAGIILNVMPCVLPVIGIKIVSFSQGNTLSRRETWVRSLAFAAGILAVFILLASLAAFAGFSWGQQFQKPVMLATIVACIVVFGLGMLDVYTIFIPTSFIRLPASISGMHPRRGPSAIFSEFFKGVFTTLLATPCSGPFLGATLAWTLRQPPAIIYLVFIALGLGMAAPYVLLSTCIPLRRWLPRPGPWMDDFKHAMGFFLFAFAIYLLRGLPDDMVIPAISFSLVMAFGAALYGRFAGIGAARGRKIMIGLSAIMLILFGWIFGFTKSASTMVSVRQTSGDIAPLTWTDFTPRLLTAAHIAGQSVCIDFTARWCWNCQYNKIMVLNSKEIAGLLRRKNVLLIKADFTQENPEAESLLSHLGSRSIPFLAIFPGDDPYRPIIMRDIVEKNDLVRALRQLPEVGEVGE